MKAIRLAALVLMLAVGAGCSRAVDDEAAGHDLLLVIVVDQLRADVPGRFDHRFASGGFRRLKADGLWFRDAWYSAGPGKTCPGHASLATGSSPARHGIVANDWYDTESDSIVYCVSDPGHSLLGESTNPNDGTSPNRLQGSTFGDELVSATAGAGRVFALAGKDRSAIMMAGHLGKALWYSRRTGRITSSDYYWSRLPGWLDDFNRRAAARYRQAVWEAELALPDSPGREARDNRPWEVGKYGLDRTFPHDLGEISDGDFPKALRYTPFLDELVTDAALELIRRENLGGGRAADVLVVGLSATDYIGHAWGPGSLEAEEGLARLDAQVARLVAAAEDAVGRERLLVVLTADHGVAKAPETMAGLGYNLGRVSAERLARALEARLEERFGVVDGVAGVALPWIYLDEQAIGEAGAELAVVESAAAEFLGAQEGIDTALLRRTVMAGGGARDPVLSRLASAVHGTRSGHLALVQSPGWYLDDTLHEDAAMHGSPYAYDLHVPLFFMGPGIEPDQVVRRVAVESVAPTLALVLGAGLPSVSAVEPLPEVIESR